MPKRLISLLLACFRLPYGASSDWLATASSHVTTTT